MERKEIKAQRCLCVIDEKYNLEDLKWMFVCLLSLHICLLSCLKFELSKYISFGIHFHEFTVLALSGQDGNIQLHLIPVCFIYDPPQLCYT